MSRAFDFTVVGVVWVVAIVVHMIGLNLFAPGTPLYEMAEGATALDGAEKAHLWFQILAIWMPLISGAGITAWAVLREYRRQAVTAVQGVHGMQ